MSLNSEEVIPRLQRLRTHFPMRMGEGLARRAITGSHSSRLSGQSGDERELLAYQGETEFATERRTMHFASGLTRPC
jgi:hypothetical protein